ncbi:uncharacterized protein LOC109839523 isoform X2 [Asparagus officinalis]|uniref:uncharacterized protein LOC109839523 isoform X2 n=1 Tax=Asparagus officinalis TaxID=4686 RepID=UPI00098DEBA3|nr:uncharacterized protein LOC109839523 isoform X2 [Asparagus officinalis]
MEEDSSGYMNTSVVIKNHLEDQRQRVEKLEGDTKAGIKNLGEEVENVKGRILEIGELRALIENLVKETKQVPESIRRHISITARLQYDELTRKQASAFTEELCGSGVHVIRAAMDDLIRSSLLPDLKNSLEDTIERQIVRGIATIASQHSKFEVSLSQKFQQDLYFRIPNPEEASSSGAKDQEHSSVGKDSSVHITTTEGASSSGAKD